MQRAILLTVLLFSSMARAAPPTVQQVHEIRTHGFMLCSNLLVYYNNQDPSTAFDPSAREAYRQSLREIDMLVATVDSTPGIAAALQGLKTSIGALEQQPENARVLYTSSLNPVMHAQNDLDEAAGAAYRASGETASVVASLHQMSLDISRLLLLHQSKGFDNIGIHSVQMDENSFGKIDRRISDAHQNLLRDAPEMKKELDEVWRNYNFVRQRLMADDKGGVSRSASLYLGKGVEMLNMLARNSSQ